MICRNNYDGIVYSFALTVVKEGNLFEAVVSRPVRIEDVERVEILSPNGGHLGKEAEIIPFDAIEDGGSREERRYSAKTEDI